MRLVEINQVGPFLGMKTTIPAMMRNRGGSIVNISSTNGFEGYGGTIAYTASKFAVRGMTKTAALEYGKAGIRINSIHPGGIDTPMTRGADLGEMTDEEQNAMYAMFAMGRVGQARRGRAARPVPGVRRVELLHRIGVHRRRRHDGRYGQPVRPADLRLTSRGRAQPQSTDGGPAFRK